MYYHHHFIKGLLTTAKWDMDNGPSSFSHKTYAAFFLSHPSSLADSATAVPDTTARPAQSRGVCAGDTDITPVESELCSSHFSSKKQLGKAGQKQASLLAEGLGPATPRGTALSRSSHVECSRTPGHYDAKKPEGQAMEGAHLHC